MKYYFKKVIIWYAIFSVLPVVTYAVVENIKVEGLITFALLSFIVALAMPFVWKVFMFAVKICTKITWFFIKVPFTGTNEVRTGKNNDANGKKNSNTEPRSKEQKTSGAAKAAFVMSAVALARTSKPSKVPQATSRDGGDRNISCHQRSGNKWLVTFETFHPATGWQPDSREIDTATAGFNTWGGWIDITWR